MNFSFAFAADTSRESGMTDRILLKIAGLRQMKTIMPSAILKHLEFSPSRLAFIPFRPLSEKE